jgi:hypothetical protein
MRPEHLATPEALDTFLHSFEAGTLAKQEWTHAAHIAAAACYLFNSDFATVLPIMRARIRAFNLSVGTANTETSGYHETLTQFWLQIVAELLRQRQPTSRLEAAQQAVAIFGEARTLHTLYYSGNVVTDTQARRQWRAPDLLPLPDGAA